MMFRLKVLPIVPLLFLFMSAYGQEKDKSKGIYIAYDNGFSSQNLSVGWAFGINERITIVPGLRIHLNQAGHDNQNFILKNRYHAGNVPEFFGLSNDIRYSFPLNFGLNNLFIYHNIQAMHLRLRSDNYLYLGLGQDGKEQYFKSSLRSDPFLSIDNVIGAGLQVYISGNFFLVLKAGAGVISFINLPSNIFVGNHWDLSSTFSIGVFYSL